MSPNPPNPPDFQGTWLPLRAEMEGTQAPIVALNRMEMVLQSSGYSMRFGAEAADEGAFSFEARLEHYYFLFRSLRGTNAGREIPALAQIRGDRMRICFGMNGVRPDDFTSPPGSQRYLVVYRRKGSVPS